MQRNVHLGKRVLSMAAAAVLAVGCVALPIPAPQAEPESTTLPYMDTSLSFEERAADLVSRMTLEEKVSQMGTNNPAVSRLGIAKYDFWTECLHGVARLGKATSFPYSIAMAASWDPAMIEEITDAISDEARGYANGTGRGLSYFSPTINMARDPRWGRDHESYGEDPYLTGQIGTSFVKGLQGDDEKYLKVIATIKHYAANNSEYNRHTGTSNMDDRTLREYYTRAFKSVIQNVDVGSVMSSYNRVNGIPASANTYLLDTLLRKTFGFKGYVVSDCGAIEDITRNHKWAPEELGRPVTIEESIRYALAAGCDIDCGSIYPNYAKSAVENGVVSEDLIDLELLRIFTARMKTGEFDPKEDVAYRNDAKYSFDNTVETAAHKQLAEDSANDGIVLLKNDKAKSTDTKSILPLDASTKDDIVMVGDIANAVELGGYSGSPSEANTTTPIQGMENLGAHVTYVKGGTSTSNSQYICNLKSITLTKADGTTVKLDAKDAKEMKGCNYETGKGNIGNVTAGATLMFKKVNIADTTEITFELAADNAALPGNITVSMDSVSGMQFTSVDTPKTGGWQTYKKVTGKVSDLGGYTEKDLYLTFSSLSQEVAFSAADEASIKKAKAVVVCLQGNTSGEGTDRSTIVMPAYQVALANTVAELNPNTIVYLQTVGVVELGEFMDNVPAILWTCYNGQAQGNAIARVLYGEVNPNAKLPVTWYAKNSALETIDDYDIRSNDDYAGWTYQYYTGPQTYPFGYGMSYTTYQYSNVTVDKTTATPNDTLKVSVDVQNTGTVDGKEIVQLYLKTPNADGVNRPLKQLKAFDKVALKAGEKKTVTLDLDLSDCYFWDEDAGHNVYDQGKYTIQVGPSSADATALETSFTMDGELTPELANVTVRGDRLLLNAANASKVVTAEVTATMNDDSFHELKAGEVKYTSSNDKVAMVDENGIVRPVASGVASITAAVTVNGKTMSESFPVVVKVELEDIQVDGQSIKDFHSGTTEYYVPLDDTSKVPTVTVPGAPEGSVSIVNATAVPGTTTVTVNIAGVSSTYTLHFTKRSHEYVALSVSGMDKEYTAQGKKTLECGWTAVDGNVVDLTSHDLSDLHLRLVMTLEQTGATIIEDSQAYRSGFLRMKSQNGAEVGWYMAKLNLKTGVNYIDIPLTKVIDSRKDTIDWTKINGMRFYIDSLNNYEGPFKATLEHTMVVDTSLQPLRETLWDLVNDDVDETLYTEASLVPYREAKAAVQALIFQAEDLTEQQVNAAREAFQKAKDGLRKDTYMVGAFSKSAGTYTVLGNGANRKDTILYNDWKYGDNTPYDLRGDRKNLRLQLTVTFNSKKESIPAKDIWDTITVKLRSSDDPGENNYGWDFKASDLGHKQVVQLSIDMSAPSNTASVKGDIDWSDIQRLIILCPLSQTAIADPDNYTQFSMTISDVKIVDLTNIIEEKAEIKTLLDQKVDTTGKDAALVKAYTDAKAAAEAVCATELATPSEVYYAHMNLKAAIAALNGGEVTTLYGDVDGDNAVTVVDALMTLQAAADKIQLSDAAKVAADVDGKAGVSAADALMILKRATNGLSRFPVEA